MEIQNLLEKLNIKNKQEGCNAGGVWHGQGEAITSTSPVNGALLGTVQGAMLKITNVSWIKLNTLF